MNQNVGAAAVRTVVLVLLCAAPAAQAQTLREMRIDNLTNITDFNAEDCSDDSPRQLRVFIEGLERVEYLMRFIRYPVIGPNGPCPLTANDPDLIEVEPAELISVAAGRFDQTFEVTNAMLLGDACTGEGDRDGIHYCFQLTINPNDINTVFVGGLRIDYDTSLPPRPSITKVTAGDTSVTVEVAEEDTGLETYTTVVQYRACEDAPPDGGAAAEESSCGATGAFSEADANGEVVVVGSLKNNQRIELRALFEDDFGNRGPATSLREVSPQQTLSPLDIYDGGDNPASCAVSCADAAGDASAALLLLGLSKRFRRRLRRARRSLTALAVLFTIGFSGSAAAEFGQTTIGIGLAPYKPAIDTERAVGSRQRIFPIYDCFFDGATLIELGGDIDTHLFDGFGSLQFGMGFSIAQAQGFAQPTSSRDLQRCQKPTNTEVQLNFFKVKPSLIYRFDPLLDWISFPLVPYGRLGFIAAGYAFTKDGDFDQGGKNPLGARFGWEGALGMMLALDFLDSLDPFVPDTTRRARANGVFDHTFLFVEGAYQEITTFGQPGLVLTPVDTLIGTSWPVLWRIGVAVELL